jgi:hypothetical protein
MPNLMPNPLLLSNPLLRALLLKALLPNSLIGMAFLILQALIVHLMHLPTIIRIVSLKGLILVGYIRQLKSRIKLWLKGGINGAVIAIFKKGIEGG